MLRHTGQELSVPQVTVIIPCHREGELLREAVDSALQQSHPRTDVVIVADGVSDPATMGVLADCERESRVRVLRQEQGGVSRARNAGLAAASGDYVIFLDGDDRLDRTFAARGVSAFEAHPEALIVGGQTMLFGAATGPFGPPFNFQQFLHESILPVGQMVRLRDARGVGGFDPELKRYEDQDFYLKILSLSPEPAKAVVQLPHPLYMYRRHPDSVTAQRDDALDLACQARVFRNNAAFFSRHARDYVEWRSKRMHVLFHYRRRYDRFETRISRAGRLVRGLPWIRGKGRAEGDPS